MQGPRIRCISLLPNNDYVCDIRANVSYISYISRNRDATSHARGFFFFSYRACSRETRNTNFFATARKSCLALYHLEGMPRVFRTLYIHCTRNDNRQTSSSSSQTSSIPAVKQGKACFSLFRATHRRLYSQRRPRS